jgi:valyl-tRNA synthetase
MLEKTYQPGDIESRVHAAWEAAEAFKAGRRERRKAPAYSIVIPPPNVTGSLHMGHALNNTLQDILCRFERMRGKDVLWQPGTDHAGIATQMVVERQMMERQEPDRRRIGREKFLEKVWAWKAESGGIIINQLKRLGASCDWSRERFTMDEGLSRAVIKVFVELYRAGLVYKDKRLVNWDPKFQTAISDLEVVSVEVKGNLWHIRYPLKDDASRFIIVATTRPETMLGDTAVAVHPDDPRYKSLIGKMVVLPLVGREIPIIADEYSDPEKGSGAVKITPAHDFNDFEVGKRHGLEMVNIFDAHAEINENAPEKYRGLDRFAARKQVVADLEAAGLIEKIEPTVHAIPHGDRSNVPIEPWLTDQWYVNAAELAKQAIAAVESGRTVFVPKSWEKTYFEWMRNIQPWCISRQLWWGHQIPAWYGPDGHVFVAEDEGKAKALAEKHYASSPSPGSRGEGRGEGEVPHDPSQAPAPHPSPLPVKGTGRGDITLTRDPDVLDTWFSSALWPFSTLGWPEETPELKRYYPTSVLVTGFDIIFFWVARMMMVGLHFMKEIPFHDVYIHALVRDEKGAKMSKSKGNVMDPLEMIEAYGADALRFTLAAMAAQGRDIKLSTSRVEGYRNFATKLWNAARFAEMNEARVDAGFDPKAAKETVNRWILGEAERAAQAVTAGIEGYRFNEAAGAIYEFVWGRYCDWYLELAKPVLMGSDEGAKAETRACLAFVRDEILKLLHPFMPFLTEELWANTAKRDRLLALGAWPKLEGLADPKADEEIGWLITLISEIRSVRTEMNVPAGARIPLVVTSGDKAAKERVARHEETIKRLARLDTIAFAKAAPKGAALIVAGATTAALPLEGIIDMSAERARLAKEIGRAEGDIAKIDAKLTNAQFVAKAPADVVEENRERRSELAALAKRLKTALARIGA